MRARTLTALPPALSPFVAELCRELQRCPTRLFCVVCIHSPTEPSLPQDPFRHFSANLRGRVTLHAINGQGGMAFSELNGRTRILWLRVVKFGQVSVVKDSPVCSSAVKFGECGGVTIRPSKASHHALPTSFLITACHVRMALD